jgi:hypothetical protein
VQRLQASVAESRQIDRDIVNVLMGMTDADIKITERLEDYLKTHADRMGPVHKRRMFDVFKKYFPKEIK